MADAGTKLELPSQLRLLYPDINVLCLQPAVSRTVHDLFLVCCRVAGKLGAFISLESTGPGGPDILFQASGCTSSLLANVLGA